MLFTGFNRRYSKYATDIKKVCRERHSPLYINYRMNAGYIPIEHWIHENGGRMVGEACHIVDLMSYFTESKVISVYSEQIDPSNSKTY